MFIWWLLGSIGCLYMGNIYCQGNAPPLASLDTPDNEVRVGMTVNDNPADEFSQNTNAGIVTESSSAIPPPQLPTTAIPEQFSCHECTNCNSKSDLNFRVCDPGITMCYKMHKRIDNTSRIMRGCSTLKGQCTVPDDDQSNLVESITCCTSHKCNEATHFKPLFFLSILSLFTILITIINI